MDTSAASVESSCEGPEATVKVVLLGDNTNPVVRTESFPRSKLREFLTDAGRVSCQLPRKLGYPLLLVSTTPGQKVIPVAQTVAISNNPLNNRHATVLAIREDSGYPTGCVVGPVYAVRTDGKDLTAQHFQHIWSAMQDFINSYYQGNNLPIPAVAFKHQRKLIKSWLQRGREPFELTNTVFLAGDLPSKRGSLAPRAPQPGHCHACGKAAADVPSGNLLKCSSCKEAYYCDASCQQSAWSKHKNDCTQAKLELTLRAAEQQLMEELGLGSNTREGQGNMEQINSGNTTAAAAGAGAGAGAASTSAGNAYVYLGPPAREELEQAVLKPEQVIARDIELPAQLSSHSPVGWSQRTRLGMIKSMGMDKFQVLEHNKSQDQTRICPVCYTHYRLRDVPKDVKTRCDKEQVLSGLCSFTCWREMNPEGSGGLYASADWYGQEAEIPEGVNIHLGGGVCVRG